MRNVLLAAIFLSLGASPTGAQETETEQQAATSVVKQIHQFEGSLNIPQMVAQLTAADPGRDQVIARVKQLMQTELLPMADSITKDPEIGFTETHAVEKLTTYLQAHDFDVGNAETTNRIFEQIRTAFLEDVAVFSAQQKNLSIFAAPAPVTGESQGKAARLTGD